ncbi:unnamed protein product [Bursaphelenchus okinawaensis]|uniref:Uncharacterized protein n=1 Tax=Bursaphelenchus okinawaensis TaxID=465554 RepID=A0A811K151_9BILA|nr:unnamed protein product [Bursaphelenchus okinawaensis]CAG9089684.1 unnamed protein product [Bursaphelenchus okinawaensis]
MNRPRGGNPAHFNNPRGSGRNRGGPGYRGHRPHPYQQPSNRPPAHQSKPKPLPTTSQPRLTNAPTGRLPPAPPNAARTNALEILIIKKQQFRATLKTCLEAAKLMSKQKSDLNYQKNYMALQSKLDELIFAQNNKPLGIQQELELIKLVTEFYKEETPATLRYDCFYTIFLAREANPRLHERRIKTLIRLASISLQLGIYSIFDDLATFWLKSSNDQSIQLLIDRLIDDFLKPPPVYGIFTVLQPLRERALEFSCFFMTYGINDNVYGPQIINIIGLWLTEDLVDVLEFFNEHQELAKRFGEQALPLLIRWDVEHDKANEEIDRFHCAITGIIVQWDHKPPTITLNSLLDLIKTADQLNEHQKSRFMDNVSNAINTGMFPTQKFLDTFTNCDSPRILREKTFSRIFEKAFEEKYG